MIFDKTLIRFRRDLLYRSLFYIINIIISGFTLISDFYYISFFESKVFDIIFDKIPNYIYKDVRNNYINFNSYLKIKI